MGDRVGTQDDRSRDTGLASMGQMFRRLLETQGLDAMAIARTAGMDLVRIPAPGERIAGAELFLNSTVKPPVRSLISRRYLL